MCRCMSKNYKQNINESFYNNGVKRLQKELDMIRFLKNGRIADSLAYITLTQFQRDLIPYFNGNILQIRKKKKVLNKKTIIINKHNIG